MRETTILLTLCVLAACSGSVEPRLTGYLYFGAGYYLGRLDLRSGRSEYVANLGEVFITHIDSLEDGRLLLSLRQDRIGRGREGILAFDLKNRGTAHWHAGSSARYLPDVDTIVYDDGQALKAIAPGRFRSNATTIFAHHFDSPLNLLEISGSKILFARERRDGSPAVADPVIRRYDFVAENLETMTRLSTECELDGAVWLGNVERIMCTDPNADGDAPVYRLVAVDGSVDREVVLPADRHFRAVAYLADQGVVVLTESYRRWTDGREMSAIWLYELEAGTNKRIAANQYLGRSVAYSDS